MKLYNSLSRKVEEFVAQDANRVTMYACGPTIYAQPHIGNARPAIVFDMLFRLLRHHYGEDNVLYTRNYTDIDDKIIAAAEAQKTSLWHITGAAARAYMRDMKELGVLNPTFTPLATSHIPAMWTMIETLLEKGHAYEVEGEVFFHVPSNPHPGIAQHGELEGHNRVEPDSKKRDPRDFVLWKPTKPGEPEIWFNSMLDAYGRPGWHIECSAMIKATLGITIDIHGGGADLRFPHHECEMAQSHCANDAPLANYWMHNGLLTVDGQKMAKSVGNMVFLDDVMAKVPGESLRFLFLQTHYRSPLDFTWEGLAVAHKTLTGFYKILEEHKDVGVERIPTMPAGFIKALDQDLNTPGAIAELHKLFKQLAHDDDKSKIKSQILVAGGMLGIFGHDYESWIHSGLDSDQIERIVQEREQARGERDWSRADALRAQLSELGVVLEDGPQGTQWRRA